MATAQVVSYIVCDEPVRPRQQVYSVKVVLDGIIEFVTPVSFSYLGLL